MAYLAEADFTLSISQDNLDEILTQASNTSGKTNAQVLTDAITWAVASVTQYLAPKYQITSAEFSKSSGDPTRNILVMGWTISYAVWKLHRTVSGRDIPEIREIEYLDASAEMTKVLSGEKQLYGVPSVSNSISSSFVSSGVKFVSNEFKDAGNYDSNHTFIPGIQ